ncbi:PilZ domain-containing protein [Sphingomonas sp.]|uniref:PilZ domain-containing protein n=1 Tax=Sphingomonas sp. TaxID=28214 RepID=UPI002DF67006|nr:PilZ domain-containing protein [Sphingomonas sp.]
MAAEAITEARNAARTNTMLAAMLEFDGERHPVFVRNLSASGAMVDGRLLPLPGESVVLHRDDQKIASTVVWTAGNRCGLSFSAHVKVDKLIKRPKPSEATPVHQARVDAIQRALRENRAVPAYQETEALVGAAAVGKKLVDEIGFAQRLVERVGEALANDSYVLTRYAVVLQQLDEAEQLLRKLHRELSAEGANGRC